MDIQSDNKMKNLYFVVWNGVYAYTALSVFVQR